MGGCPGCQKRWLLEARVGNDDGPPGCWGVILAPVPLLDWETRGGCLGRSAWCYDCRGGGYETVGKRRKNRMEIEYALRAAESSDDLAHLAIGSWCGRAVVRYGVDLAVPGTSTSHLSTPTRHRRRVVPSSPADHLHAARPNIAAETLHTAHEQPAWYEPAAIARLVPASVWCSGQWQWAVAVAVGSGQRGVAGDDAGPASPAPRGAEDDGGRGGRAS